MSYQSGERVQGYICASGRACVNQTGHALKGSKYNARGIELPQGTEVTFIIKDDAATEVQRAG